MWLFFLRLTKLGFSPKTCPIEHFDIRYSFITILFRFMMIVSLRLFVINWLEWSGWNH